VKENDDEMVQFKVARRKASPKCKEDEMSGGYNTDVRSAKKVELNAIRRLICVVDESVCFCCVGRIG